MLRFGIAGVGRHGARYARHLHRGDVPGARVTKVWRRDRARGEAVARDVEAAYVPTFDALVSAPDVDAVIMAVPSGVHHALAPRVAAAGKPLLLEKPIARTTAEAHAIIDTFAGHGVPLTIAQTLRFDPLIERATAATDRLGPLVAFGFEQRIEPRGLAWEEDPTLAGGGVLAQTAIHTIDALRVLTRPATIEVIHSLLARVDYPTHEDLGLLHLGLVGCPGARSAIYGDVRASKVGASRHHRFSLFYRDGALELDFIDRHLVTTVEHQRTRAEVPAVPTLPALTRAFVRFVSGAGPNPVAPNEALAALEVVEAAYRLGRLKPPTR